MKRKYMLGNLAMIAVFLLGIAFAGFARAQELPEATPTPDLHYLNQAIPGGVPLDATLPAEVTPTESSAPTEMAHDHVAAPADAAVVDAVAVDAVAVDAVPVDAAAPAAAAPAAVNAPPCEVSNSPSCTRIYIPVMIRGLDASAADTLSWRATVSALATKVAKATRTPTPVRPTATATRIGATATRTPTRTPTPRPTSTGAATSVPAPTSTTMPPMTGSCLNCVDPSTLAPVPNPAPNVSGQMCPVWAHDLWVVPGPNGKLYRTWHPAIQPAGMAGAGCNFDHSHGTQRDPRQSAADNTLPAYGYDADLHGMAENHVGFKTEWANRGECNTLESFCSTSDLKLTVHMGTAGAGRLTLEMHTFIFDLIGDKGSIAHVRGMASTGDPATQCDPAPDVSGARGFRLLGMPKDQAKACGIDSPYEVWQFHLTVGNNIITSKFATFDPVTVARRGSDGKFALESTGVTWPNPPYTGCMHDVYFGGFVIKSNVDAPDMHGVRQYVKMGSDQGQLVLDTVGKNTYKRPFDGCGPVPYTAN